MHRVIIGIDPGLSGGIVRLYDGKIDRVCKMPETAKQLVAELTTYSPLMYKHGDPPRGPVKVYLEHVGALQRRGGPVCNCCHKPLQQQGLASTAKFVRHTGWIEGILTALGIDWEHVRPAVWQKALDCLTGGDKNVSKARAQSIFLDSRVRFTHANSDAALIAYYGWTVEKLKARSVEPITREDYRPTRKSPCPAKSSPANTVRRNSPFKKA